MSILDVDHSFINKYDVNIKSILSKKAEISGTKSISSDLAEEWINSQKTELKKNVAKFFIHNTVYVSFDDYFNGIKSLVATKYREITDGANQIILCSGLRTKSQYMTAVIALYFIKQFGFREPDVYITTLPKKNVQDPILVFDDMSYSGSQMGSMFEKMFTDRFRNKDEPTFEMTQNELPRIHLLLYGVNNMSLHKLENVSCTVKVLKEVNVSGVLQKILKQEYLDFESPFKTYYFKKFITFREIDADMCNLVNYFFSPYLLGNPYLSLYFDHKIADDVSTYMKVLQFGPIIPKSYSISSFQEHRDSYIEGFGDVYTDIVDPLSVGFTRPIVKGILPDLVNRYGLKDVRDEQDTKILFKPFITGCKLSADFYSSVEKMSYNEFLFPENTEILEKTLCLTPFYKNDWDTVKVEKISGGKSNTMKRIPIKHSNSVTSKNTKNFKKKKSIQITISY
jgi:hypothetical protein